MWKRAPGGPWRVHVDLGISHPGAALADAPLEAGTTPQAEAGQEGTIAAAEARFAAHAAGSGDAAAYSASASSDVRLYREGHAPFIGRTEALSSPAASEMRSAWVVDSVQESAAGDLGYAAGRYGPTGGATTGHFVRIWRRERAGWRIALDIVNELTPR